MGTVLYLVGMIFFAAMSLLGIGLIIRGYVHGNVDVEYRGLTNR